MNDLTSMREHLRDEETYLRVAQALDLTLRLNACCKHSALMVVLAARTLLSRTCTPEELAEAEAAAAHHVAIGDAYEAREGETIQ